MTSYAMDPCLHASLKEKASNGDVYLPESHTSTSSKVQREQRTPVLTPELSLTSEDGQVLGIDVHTGLPKLAVELLPEMEEVQPMGPQISTRNETTTNQSKRERKSVSFDPNSDVVKRQRSMSDSKKHEGSPVSSSAAMDEGRVYHYSLDSPPNIRKRPAKNRPSSLLNKNRSRSVFIKLQYPRTPPLTHRNLSVVGESDSDTDVQTAPVVDSSSGNTFFGPSSDLLNQRRASDSKALDKNQYDSSKVSGIRATSTSTSGLERSNAGGLSFSAPETSPSVPRWQASLKRRSSYLYLTDDSDSDQEKNGGSTKGVSRTSSMSSHVGDETYITPYAQILANLQRVRAHFLALMELPPDTRTSHSRPHSVTTPAPSPLPNKKLLEENKAKVALETLEEFDWCLKKLETIDSAKSMGTMAQDKFKRMLSRELSQLSSNSRSGSQVAEWVNRMTSYDTSEKVDRVLIPRPTHNDLLIESPLEHHLSRSMAHDEWEKFRRTKSEPNREYCERVPTFGVSSPNMDNRKMREFMTHMDTWNVDAFHLNTISGGNPLISSSYMIFKNRNFFAEFQILPRAFINFVGAIQRAYFLNPYHNCIHATDVLMATDYMLKAKALDDVFSNLEIFAALFAALIHDVGHPARTNQFLINTGDKLALLYNDNSVLENHHLAIAFKTMQDPNCNFLEHFESDQRQAFRRMVIDMVLATDMSRHFKHLGELKTLLETKKVANEGILVLDKYSDRSEVLQCLIHCADLSNPSKPVDLAAEWARRIMQEQFDQGDEEKRLGIPLNPLGDRDQVCVGKCQVTFLDFIIYPLWETWAELVYPDAQEMLDNISKTREYWDSQITKCSSPPLSEDSSGSAVCTVESPVEETCPVDETCSVASPQTKEHSSMNCSDRNARTESVDSVGSDTLQEYIDSPLNQRRTSYKASKDTKREQEISQDDGKLLSASSDN